MTSSKIQGACRNFSILREGRNPEFTCGADFSGPSSAPRQHVWESAKVSHKRVFALLTPEIRSEKMTQMLQKPVFALPGCQRMSVNTLLCDTLALAECRGEENAPENAPSKKILDSRIGALRKGPPFRGSTN